MFWVGSATTILKVVDFICKRVKVQEKTSIN